SSHPRLAPVHKPAQLAPDNGPNLTARASPPVASFTARTSLLSRWDSGRVAEWFKAPVLKTGVPARVPWVRIPPLPPETIDIIVVFDLPNRCAQSRAQWVDDAVLLFVLAVAVVAILIACGLPRAVSRPPIGALVRLSAGHMIWQSRYGTSPAFLD